MDKLLIRRLECQAGELIFKRGVTYYLQGNIKQFIVTPQGQKQSRIQATVQGANNYVVNITARISNHDLEVESSCTCPYDFSDLCKHSVAVLYKFLAEGYPELSPPGQKTGSDGVESLKKLASRELNPKIILEYELKGLKKVSAANFKLRLVSKKLEPKYLNDLVDDLCFNGSYNLYRAESILVKFDNFDRLVLEHLAKIQTRRDSKTGGVFFAKTKENLDFILTILSQRKIYLEDSKESLILGETIVPRVILRGDETYLQIDHEVPVPPGVYYQSELDCFLQDNVLHLIDSTGIEELPGGITIPPSKLGHLLFEILPELQKKILLELPPELNTHHLTFIEPEFKLDFDYRENEIICQPEVKIGDRVYHDKESLRLTTLDPEYHRSPDNPTEWLTINQSALQNFLHFLEQNNFTVSPEGLTIKDQGHLFKFMLDGFKQIPAIWKVVTSESFAGFSVASVKLEPVVDLDLSSDINWFEFKIYYSLGGKTYTHQEIFRMIKKTSSGTKYIQAGNQIFLLEESRTLERIDEALPELPVKNERPRYELYNILFYRLLFQDLGVTIKGNAIYDLFEGDISGKNLVIDCKLPENLVGELRQYQKEGFQWLRFLHKYNFAGILADDMGLGKTIQALTLVKSLPKETPALVVCPRSLIYNWAAEIEKFYPGTRHLVYHGSPEERETMRELFYNQEFVVTTYDTLSRDADVLCQYPFFYCILDEAQHIKNHLTQRAKEVKRIQSRYRLVMTGTPIENGLDELWSVFDFLMPGYLESQPKFTARFVTPLKKSGDQEVLKLLKQKVAPFILRRKEEVLTELPEKVISQQNVFMTKLQGGTYRTILEDLKGGPWKASPRTAWRNPGSQCWRP